MSQLPLQGIRIVDASVVVMGPYASQWLADLGAEVIKVESPEGDSTRYTGPGHENGMSALFLGVNRNKKSVVIDLKKPEGPTALRQLIATADVFMHSMRPQKLGAVGLEPDALLAAFPRLVFAGLHGFTASGPYGGKPAYDDIIQGLSGSAALMEQQSGVARYFPCIAADKTSGLVAAMAIMAALMKRQATGVGGMVEVPMFETMVAFNLVENFYGEHFEPPLSAPGYPRVLADWRRPYRTSDGYVCMMPYTNAHWQKFFQGVDQPELASDVRFTSMAARTQHIEALYEITGQIVAQHDTAYWLALCERLEIPAARMNTLADLKTDPHLQATQFFAELDDPAMGALRFPGVPVLFDGERPPVNSVPRLGEHTHDVFAQAGVSADTVSTWLASGAVQTHEAHGTQKAPAP
jgi:crotonobetainyl-CoA:carnitine CoA-transferase CaiB-like acyl-CoA transferase